MKCRHFGECGGCSLQDLAYPEQLERKRKGLEELLAPFWSRPVPITPSPDPFYYRNKVELSFGRLGEKVDGSFVLGGTVLGFKAKGKWYKTLDIQECLLLSPELGPLLDAIRTWAKAENLEGYDTKSGKGFLRALLVREAKGTGQRMVMLLTREGAFPNSSFEMAVRAAYPAATLLRGVNNGISDTVTAERVEVIHGTGTIEETLDVGRKLRFRISPFSFFQTNTTATERLYRRIRQLLVPSPAAAPSTSPAGGGEFPLPSGEGARRAGEGMCLDLYGGAGGIAFTASDLFDRIISVENNASASEDGRYNAKVNGIANVEFVTAAVEDFLRAPTHPDLRLDLSPKGERDLTVVIDPPRGGIHPKALKALVELRAPSVVYVSCNPKMLAADLKALTAAYSVEAVEAFDLFPHTDHVEAVVKLKLL